ncbi:MAG TPA: neutral zinc metallopeptidase [Longimicrobium sp.]|nr:neutral zinc metallopeptidase [Longimicrobium sp.]
MRWGGLRPSSNVEDRRGMGGGGMAIGGGIGTIVVALIVMLLGGNPGDIIGGGGGQPGAAPPGSAEPRTAEEDTMAEMTRRVLGGTEDVWGAVFQKEGQTYEPARLVMYTGGTSTACGYGQAAMGPFYCPGDRTVYVDLAFYADLRERFGAPGDLAQAYVVAHEVGHHVQTLTGTSQQVNSASQRVGRAEANELSVRQELQADCYAGLWVHHQSRMTQDFLEPNEVQEALAAAAAIGDDRLQRETQGRVVPESFTHGTSEQRQRWFQRGYQSGDHNQCDTFNTNQL